MEALKVKMPDLCLLLLMALLLLPGSEGNTCATVSRTYITLLCVRDTCVKHCHSKGYTGGKNYICELLCRICYDEQINTEFT
uniref:Knottin scorpion toxin-like domain-containing protein n=1 Tax=Aegilops tauschii TaxID=37682 RepID=R7W5E5_AEGTA